MNSRSNLDPQLHKDLTSIYEEIMWLSVRPNVTPGRARAWYTHIMAEALKRKLRQFTGKVSKAAAARGDDQLMLEHFKRIQTTLTALVERHRASLVAKTTPPCAQRAIIAKPVSFFFRGEVFPATDEPSCGKKCFVERSQTPPLSSHNIFRCPARNSKTPSNWVTLLRTSEATSGLTRGLAVVARHAQRLQIAPAKAFAAVLERLYVISHNGRHKQP